MARRAAFVRALAATAVAAAVLPAAGAALRAQAGQRQPSAGVVPLGAARLAEVQPTFVTSWTVREDRYGAESGICPSSIPFAREVGDIAYDEQGRLLMTICCGVAQRSNCEERLATIEPVSGTTRSARFDLPFTASPMAYDPATDSVLAADTAHVLAVPLPGVSGDGRQWAIMRAASGASNVPADIAAGPGGMAYTFSSAGVDRYGPATQRYSPWPAAAAFDVVAKPGSIFVDSQGRVYAQDPQLGAAVLRFSSRGAYDASWRVQDPSGTAGPVGGYPGQDTVYLLHGDGARSAFEVERLAPDGSIAAHLPVTGTLVAQPRPALAVAPDGGYALLGENASGQQVLYVHGPDGSLLMTMALSAASSARSQWSGAHVSADEAGRVLVNGPFATTVFDRSGTELEQWALPDWATEISLGAAGGVYVRRAEPGAPASSPVSWLERRALTGEVEWASPIEASSEPGLAASAGLVFATMRLRGALAVLDAATGQQVGQLQTSANDDVFLPIDVTTDGAGILYALDQVRMQIQVWDLAASALRPVGRIALAVPGVTARPDALAAGPNGALAVLEWVEAPAPRTQRIRGLDRSGATLWTLGVGQGPLAAMTVEDIAFDGMGRLIVLGRPAAVDGRRSVTVLSLGGAVPTPPGAETATPAPTPPAANEGVCSVEGTKWAEPGEIWLGESVTVTLTLGQSCPKPTGPADIVLTVDTSGSMEGEKAESMGQAVQAFIEGLDLDRHRLGVVTFGSNAQLKLPLTNDRNRLASLPGNFGAAGTTNMHGAMQVAVDHLRSAARPDVKRVIVFFTDGQWNTGGDPIPLAEQARAEGIRIFAVGTADAQMETLIRMTGSVERAYFAFRPAELPDLYRKIADLIGSDAGGVVLDDLLGQEVSFVAGSVSEPPLALSGAGLRWAWPGFASAPATITYRVRPLRTGWVPTNESAWFDYEDADQVVRRYAYPVPTVLVKAPWTPTPTATPTSTNTPTATPTATITPTPEPRRLFLPILLREPPCQPATQRIDAVLVIDTSSSMTDRTAAGRQKLAAACEAAMAFLDRLRLWDGDQAAIVYFHRQAWLAQALTGDRRALNRALAGPSVGTQTCLACGVQTAFEELRTARHQAGHTAVMVVLTDGLSNPRPVSEAVSVAADAKAAGVVIFTVGLGTVLDFDALRQMASEPSYFYQTADAEELDEIYAAIAVEIPCPAGTYWGRRP